MDIIFKNFNVQEFVEATKNNTIVQNILRFLKNNKLVVKITTLCMVGILALFITVVSSGITLGFKVKYSGKIIGMVSGKSVCESAIDKAVCNINSKEADTAISIPRLSLTITVTDKLDNADKVADAIIANTDNIVSASELIVNGETLLCAESKKLNQLLTARKESFFIDGAQNQSMFVDSVEIKTGYYLKSDIREISEVQEIVSKLQVKTVSKFITNITIPFKTENIRTDKQPLGYYKVKVAGKDGISRKTLLVENMNGQEISRKELESEIISEPVNQVVTIGTAKVQISAAEKANITSAGFICPISSGKFVISSYYGDGRNHKGIDLAANRGVPIFTVASGTVIYSGYDGDYGYSVVIDHGTGIQTRYAHASALCVGKGQIVSQGDMIASVGNTGKSTGNHLHFEVIVNGVRVNPAPYIGLG